MVQAFAHCLVVMLFAFALPRQIDIVDLTKPAVASNSERPIPAGCEKLTAGVIADGWPMPEDHRPRQIVVEVVSVKDMKPALGSKVEAVVQLKNSDSQPIQIPWGTDQRIIEQGQKQDSLQWEAGTFEFVLRKGKGQQVRLKSLTSWLHSSKFVPSSQLTIQPGQLVSALVSFKIEDEYQIDLRLKEGQWQLSAEWVQVGRTSHVKDCSVSNGYFHYDDFYQQQNPSITIHVIGQGTINQNLPKSR